MNNIIKNTLLGTERCALQSLAQEELEALVVTADCGRPLAETSASVTLIDASNSTRAAQTTLTTQSIAPTSPDS